MDGEAKTRAPRCQLRPHLALPPTPLAIAGDATNSMMMTPSIKVWRRETKFVRALQSGL